MEIFAGCARLSGAVRESGLLTGCPFELEHGDWFDITCPRILRLVLTWIKNRRVWLVHLAPPCTFWSQALAGRSQHHQQTGLSAAHAEEVVLLARARQPSLASIVLISADSLTSSLSNPLREPSTTMTDCVTPHSYAAVSVCSDTGFVFGDPNRRPSPRNGRRPVALIVVPRAELGAQAQLLGTQGELFVDAGLNEATAIAVGGGRANAPLLVGENTSPPPPRSKTPFSPSAPPSPLTLTPRSSPLTFLIVSGITCS